MDEIDTNKKKDRIGKYGYLAIFGKVYKYWDELF